MNTWTAMRLGLLSTVAVTSTPAPLQAQERSFHGFHVEVEAGREDLIAGAFVDGIDFLAQETRGVASLVVGARYQTLPGVVLGVEGTWGVTDGDFVLDDAGRGLNITYANDSQTSIGGQVGFAFDTSRPVLLFAYASEVTRHFDVTVAQGGTAFDQDDEQGMLRYGVGVETALLHNVHLRFRMGAGRADFGDAVTNITPDRPLQFSFGIGYHF